MKDHCGSTQIHMHITQSKWTSRSIYFIAIAQHTRLILRNKGLHEFMLTILPQSQFNTLMDLSYSAFVSTLFISNDSHILHSCMLDNFASVFSHDNPWNVQLHLTFPIFLPCYLLGVQLIQWAHIFLFVQYITPTITTLLIRK